MKKYVFYPGCLMQTEQYAYEMSIREIFPLLGVRLIDVKGFSCCGTPLKSVNQLLTLSLSARNLALAEKEGYDVFAPCSICHLGLSECKHVLDSNPKMKQRVNTFLADENLRYNGTSNVIHTIDLLHDVVKVDTIEEALKKPLKKLKIATHYGCHLIRPSEIGRPVDSENPQKMETILKSIGVKPVDYAEKLDCCGGLLTANLPESALTKTGQKLQRVKEQGFDALVDVCPWCHRQFDAKQKQAAKTIAQTLDVSVLYLTQLIGIGLGIKKEKLGLDLNHSPVESLQLGGN
ncbi:MAG: CoB--CoM heterodisulfide reductase iron-sulfur subunit B family protein [Candidatus Thermoplasmatota archaeon]|nr:CoB--CoM heterodisulfide reductase iron-sulfur subunit B family protein [Candidatus Thermoplasmatota archaeon]